MGRVGWSALAGLVLVSRALAGDSVSVVGASVLAIGYFGGPAEAHSRAMLGRLAWSTGGVFWAAEGNTALGKAMDGVARRLFAGE